MNKRMLREKIKKLRDTVSDEERIAKSNIIFEKIISLDEYNKAETIMCFASFGSEVNTFPLLNRILEDKKNLFLPRVVIVGATKHLELYRVKNPGNHLLEGVYGIMEPDPKKCDKANVSEVQLFICPGVAFDLKGNRLGYGAGYYDRLFAGTDLRCKRIGISFDLQIVNILETESFDIPMNMVITEKREITGM